jgi:hypothetical protein
LGEHDQAVVAARAPAEHLNRTRGSGNDVDEPVVERPPAPSHGKGPVRTARVVAQSERPAGERLQGAGSITIEQIINQLAAQPRLDRGPEHLIEILRPLRRKWKAHRRPPPAISI